MPNNRDEAQAPLQIKICGMREAENIAAIAALRPDFLGFIFYPSSRRFVGDTFAPSVLASIHETTARVGVFVDADPLHIVECVERYGLHVVQLHGKESVAQTKTLRSMMPSNLRIWKAFGIEEGFAFSQLAAYEDLIERFLFDTKVPAYGGSGVRFDWSLLMRNACPLPYMLAGGLDASALPAIAALRREDPRLVGIDLNSRLESAPGLKSVAQVEQVIREVRDGLSC